MYRQTHIIRNITKFEALVNTKKYALLPREKIDRVNGKNKPPRVWVMALNFNHEVNY